MKENMEQLLLLHNMSYFPLQVPSEKTINFKICQLVAVTTDDSVFQSSSSIC